MGGKPQTPGKFAHVFTISSQAADLHLSILLDEPRQPEPASVPVGTEQGQWVLALQFLQTGWIDRRSPTRRENSRQFEQHGCRPSPGTLQSSDGLLLRAKLLELLLDLGMVRN